MTGGVGGEDMGSKVTELYLSHSILERFKQSLWDVTVDVTAPPHGLLLLVVCVIIYMNSFSVCLASLLNVM